MARRFPPPWSAEQIPGGFKVGRRRRVSPGLHLRARDKGASGHG